MKPALGREFSPNKGNGALPRDDFCKLNQHAQPGTTRDTRPSDRRVFSVPNVRAENASSCNSDVLPPSVDTRASAAPQCPDLPPAQCPPVDAKHGVSRGPPHIDDTQRVKRKAGCYAVHGCDHRWEMRRATLMRSGSHRDGHALEARDGLGFCAAVAGLV